MRKFRAGKFKILYIVLNFPTLDFLVHKIKEREFQFLLLFSDNFTFPRALTLPTILYEEILRETFKTSNNNFLNPNDPRV